jgi:hypothetical protein
MNTTESPEKKEPAPLLGLGSSAGLGRERRIGCVGHDCDKCAKGAKTLREAQKAARDNKKALLELSDTVLMFLHWMDAVVGPEKSIPRDVSTKLGKACTFLDMQNDGARLHRLGKSITAEGKKKDAMKLRGLLAP